MQKRLNIATPSSEEWIACVLENFDFFLQDHANCERKASSMALSFIAKYPDRTHIIPQLMETAIEELEHFKSVYEIMLSRGIKLTHSIPKDEYVGQLMTLLRSGREERFMDRLILASLIETRGAERFKKIYENIKNPNLKDFYHKLWASEAHHGEIFIDMALHYFKEKEVYHRLAFMIEKESQIIQSLPIQPALH